MAQRTDSFSGLNQFGTRSTQRKPVWRGRVAIALSTLLLAACGGISNSRVPVGTWKDVATDRYISIEANKKVSTESTSKRAELLTKKHYTALLFSIHETDGPAQAVVAALNEKEGTVVASAESAGMQDAAPASNRVIIRERTLAGTMEEGVFKLDAGATDISVFYHPSKEIILVNGVSEFHRVPDKLAQRLPTPL